MEAQAGAAAPPQALPWCCSPPDATRRHPTLPPTCAPAHFASCPAMLQAKPWSEVLDRTAFAKPAGMAEVRYAAALKSLGQLLRLLHRLCQTCALIANVLVCVLIINAGHGAHAQERGLLQGQLRHRGGVHHRAGHVHEPMVPHRAGGPGAAVGIRLRRAHHAAGHQWPRAQVRQLLPRPACGALLHARCLHADAVGAAAMSVVKL